MRLLTKAEACRELEVSLSTLDRRIDSGQVRVRYELQGLRHRVYVVINDPPDLIKSRTFIRQTLSTRKA